MTLVRVFLCFVIAWPLLMAEGAEPPPALVFQEDFGPDAAERWVANSAQLAMELVAEEGDGPCLRIEDSGGNSQAFVRLAVEPDAIYRLEVDGQRRAGNRGEWLGLAAVSSTGGRGNQTSYIARPSSLASLITGTGCPSSSPRPAQVCL